MKILLEPKDIVGGLKIRVNNNNMLVVASNFNNSRGIVYSTVSIEYGWITGKLDFWLTQKEMADELNSFTLSMGWDHSEIK